LNKIEIETISNTLSYHSGLLLLTIIKRYRRGTDIYLNEMLYIKD